MAYIIRVYRNKMSKVAVIVETRCHQALSFVLNNVATVLPKEWKIQIFHGTTNYEFIQDIINKNNILNNRIIFNNLGIDSVSQEDSSKIMLSEELWNACEGETILYFECDSMLCPNSKYKVSDFEHFDYIGGYWGNKMLPLEQTYPHVMNGGVSIRKKQYMLDIIKYEMEPYLQRGGNPCEDYFVSDRVKNRPKVKDVITFSIDNGYIAPYNNEAPFALHKPWGDNPRKGHGAYYNQLKQVCPEIEILKELNKG
jgi:hypothetical protein